MSGPGRLLLKRFSLDAERLEHLPALLLNHDRRRAIELVDRQSDNAVVVDTLALAHSF